MRNAVVRGLLLTRNPVFFILTGVMAHNGKLYRRMESKSDGVKEGVNTVVFERKTVIYFIERVEPIVEDFRKVLK
ncbi:MAG: hypothetical protein QM534_14870 [Sediminibacterium sp.]|nr:hypothetical protein [Sediminibacterium sp.]